MGNLIDLQILITPTVQVMEEAAAMEIILIIIVTEQPTIQMVERLEMVKIIRTKVTTMNIKMEHTNQELAVSPVMLQSSKIHNIKHNNTMEMLVKNTDKVRYFKLHNFYFNVCYY